MFVSRKVRHYSLTTREWNISEQQKESSSTKFEINHLLTPYVIPVSYPETRNRRKCTAGLPVYSAS